MKFPKGHTGNPGGRPADTPEIKAAKEAIRKLAPIAAKALEPMLSNPKTKAWAIDMVFKYSIPRPAQEVELSGKDGGPLRAVVIDER